MQEVFKMAVSVLHWHPEYVLDDMSLEVFALALEGHVEVVDPERAKKIKDYQPPDPEMKKKVIEAFNKMMRDGK